MKHELLTDRQEWRITLPGCDPIVFSDMNASMQYANQSKHATIEVRHVLEWRVESHWDRKT